MDPESNASGDELTIGERMDRLEEIAETLEAGSVDLERAKELRTETDDHLLHLRTELDVEGESGEFELENTCEE